MKDLLTNLKGVYVRSFEFDSDGQYNRADLDIIRRQFSDPGWNQLVGVRSRRERTDVDVYVWMDGKKPGGIAVLASEPRQLTIVNLIGAIDLEQLRRLDGELGIPKLDLERKKEGAVAMQPDAPAVQSEQPESQPPPAASQSVARRLDRITSDRRDHPRDRRDAGGRACARETNSFDTLVRSLKSHDDVEVTSPPMMWLARLVVKAAQPEGVMDVRVAMLEGRGLSRVARRRVVQQAAAARRRQGWSPLVRVRSRKSGELSAVHVREHRGRLSLLVVAIDRGDGVVVEATVKPETFAAGSTSRG